ncbi:enoyl-CoA hydratase/isomerase family protein [Nocardioides sp. KC13]|uniref:enoyl-CoA hydratase n=1 Tax=Nocardioides turkmenicus TaxID=2711220 RepID=A0A6M1QYC8_9ACTN|nr:enoyl-CoA hydratase/isomerase family protein [Nocardioides sp. KC13]NGN92836.1 enoyl-CoA hydratase/isomerase family protein [Nocardioides sp. KC13]
MAETRDQLVRLHDHGDVVVVQLDRPAKLNALSTAVEQQLLDAVASARVASARAVVFAGSERAFSAGADTSELPQMTPDRIAAYYRGSGSVYEAVARLPQPTVAAIAGYCLGGGFELALACDLRIAAEGATFGLPEVALGILPSSGGITRLVRAVGAATTRDLVLCGDRFDAAEAHRLGLVRDVVAPGEVDARALDLAKQLSALPPLAVAWTKAAIDAAAESSTATSLLVEQLAYAALNQAAHKKDEA